jgi:hypothetical protein
VPGIVRSVVANLSKATRRCVMLRAERTTWCDEEDRRTIRSNE